MRIANTQQIVKLFLEKSKTFSEAKYEETHTGRERKGKSA